MIFDYTKYSSRVDDLVNHLSKKIYNEIKEAREMHIKEPEKIAFATVSYNETLGGDRNDWNIVNYIRCPDWQKKRFGNVKKLAQHSIDWFIETWRDAIEDTIKRLENGEKID